MCRRDTRDPLLRLMLDRYQLHLLAVPRMGVAVGDLYVEQGQRVSAPGNLRHLLDPELVLPPLRVAEPMADVAGLVSSRVQAEVGLDLLAGFLRAVAPGCAAATVRAAYESTRVQWLRFSFEAATRDSLDILELGRDLAQYRWRDAHPLQGPRSRFYLVTAVARARSVTLTAEASGKQDVSVELSALETALTAPELSVAGHRTAQVTFTGTQPVAFGVELHEIAFDAERASFRMGIPRRPVRVRGHGAPAALDDVDSRTAAFIGGSGGEVLLRVD